MSDTSEGAFDASGESIIQVFTFSNCGKPCSNTVKNLKERDVSFTHYKVNPNSKESEAYALWAKHNISSFPLIIVGNDKLSGSSNAQLAMMLGKNFGTEFLKPREQRYYSKHFHADGSPKIVMYGADWCPYCAKLRKSFESMGVEYIEIDVEKPRLNKTLLQDLEINGYPATWVGYTRINSSRASVITDALENY